jgi:short-subunit dehydrogenase
MEKNIEFLGKYGPWALVAGASEGIGEAFSLAIARRGVNVALIARRKEPLERLSEKISLTYRVDTKTIVADIGAADTPARAASQLFDTEVGLVVMNAALAPVGPFFSRPLEEHERLLDVNCRGALRLLHRFVPPMLARKKGGVVLMSSLAGFQGTARVAHYAASKAYLRVLAEGLWAELSGSGVEVMACCAGMTDTPTFRLSGPKMPRGLAGRVALMKALDVAESAIERLGRGPVFVPGAANRGAAFLLDRVLPRASAIRLISANTRRLYPEDLPA